MQEEEDNSTTSRELKDNTAIKSDKLEAVQESSSSESTKESIQSKDEMLRRAESKSPEIAAESMDIKSSETFNGPASSTSMESTKSNSKPRIVKPYLELHQVAMKGNWEKIKSFLHEDPKSKTADITGYNETVLHVAALMEHAGVIKELLKIFSPKELERQSTFGKTVLHIAAMSRNLEIVHTLVKANSRLTQINDTFGYTPLLLAAFHSSEKVVSYLSAKTTDDAPGQPFTGPRSAHLILTLIRSDMYDVALTLLKQYPQMAAAQTEDGHSLLTQLAIRRLHFLSGSNLSFWELWIYHGAFYKGHNDMTDDTSRSDEETTSPQISNYGKKPIIGRVLARIKELPWKFMKLLGPSFKYIEQEKLKHNNGRLLIQYACQEISKLAEDDINAFFEKDLFIEYAAMNGVVEIFTIILEHFPQLLWWSNKQNQNIFQIAIKYRREKIVNLLHERIAIMKDASTKIDKDAKGTLLHKVAELAPYSQLQSTPCPALQMQKEIQWFKGVELVIQPFLRTWVDDKNETANQVFTNEHKELIKEAEKWMKDTSNSCMLVAALIATVVFAAAFTIPGGNLDGKGTPIFLKKDAFIIFAVSDALALFSSTASILMFLSILTARYAEDDFLRALPKRLILGLATLFISIITMMVAFGSAFEIMLSEKWGWFYIPTMVLGFLPVALFMMLQFPLFVQMVWSTYGPSIFHPQKIW